jgi:cytidylate kinase
MSDRGIILIVTGVSGSGKTTVAMNLAQQLGWAFKSPIALSRETSDITFVVGRNRALLHIQSIHSVMPFRASALAETSAGKLDLCLAYMICHHRTS